MTLILTNATLVTPGHRSRDRSIVISDGSIVRIEGAEYDGDGQARTRDMGGSVVVPGFIDLHAHGAAGVDFSKSDMDVRKAADFLHARGVTGLLPTIHTLEWNELREALGRLGQACRQGPGQSLFHGIHCEGPFLNPDLAAGAPTHAFRRPTLEDWRELQSRASDTIRLLTLAPEMDGAPQVIRAAAAEGVSISAGHTQAGADRMKRAMEQGMSQVTHLFNAMTHPFTSGPNITAASLLTSGIRTQINSEGAHVSPTVMRMVYRLKGAEGIILTTDLHPAGGLPPGEYPWEGGTVENKGPVVRTTADGTMVGSACALDAGVRTMVQDVGASLPEAARMASLNPARELGIADHKGKILPGYDADLAVLDDDLQVTMTVADGRIVHEGP